MSASRDSAGDSKPSISSDSKSEATKTSGMAIIREIKYSSLCEHDSPLRILPFSPDLVACYRVSSIGYKLKVYKNEEMVSTFPASFEPHLVFSPTAGELVTISSEKAHRWKNFESKNPISEDISEMKVLCAAFREPYYIVGSVIPNIPKPIHAAPNGTWYFWCDERILSRRGPRLTSVLKQFDGKEVISIVELQEFYSMVWNQNNDIIGLRDKKLYKIKTSGIAEGIQELTFSVNLYSLTLLPDFMVAMNSDWGIKIIDTKNEMKYIGEKRLEKISTLLTNPDTGELIVVFKNGQISIFAVNKTFAGGVEFVEAASFDTKLTDIRTAEWNPYTHSILVMSNKGFKEIDLGHEKKIREAIDSYIPKDLAKITMEYLGFFAPSKPISPTDVDKPDPASADWSDLNEGPK